MKSHKSLLGKLMANEDLAIHVAKVSTASFNPKTRTILIPPWKDITDDTYDLLLGHEVGHALYTPLAGWHDAVHNHPFPKSYANILEDIRIEKKVQSRYPGLRRNFVAGYKELLERDFFGITNRDVNVMSFMNRLNVKSKCRDLVEVKFTPEEMVYVRKAYSCETFNDVIKVCNEIFEWLKDKNERAQEMNKPESDETCESPADDGNTPEQNEEVTEGGNDSLETEEEENDESTNEEENAETSEESEGGDEEEGQSGESSIDDPVSEKENESEGEPSESEEGSSDHADDSEGSLDADFDYTDASTDDEFRNKEESLVDTQNGELPNVIHIPPMQTINDCIINWKQAAELRVEHFNAMKNNKYSSAYNDYSDYFSADIQSSFEEDYKLAIQSANSLVKEFERKKAAWESQRGTEAKRGSLNMVKLHQYKFSEDIFLSTLNTPNAKSHGIISLLDFSGSMSGDMVTTITQSFILSMFAKKAGIPFKFYSFTSGKVIGNTAERKNDEVDISDTLLVEQFSSEMSIKNLTKAFETLRKAYHKESWGYSRYAAPCDRLGGTPLDECIALMLPIIDNFKKTQRVQKVSLVTISDGESSNSLFRGYGYNSAKKVYYKNKSVVEVKTGQNTWSSRVQEQLLTKIRAMGVTTMGYYITAKAPNKYTVNTLQDGVHVTEAEIQKIRKEFRDTSMAKVKKDGYDFYAYIKGGMDLSIEENAFDGLDANSNKGDINKALKNMGKSKIFSRAFAKSFTDVIA